ncbi:MAG TPA: FtsX-like permease family protein [Thermoanaerobaculales bacterium]|nr:FtsX-like permease family protein [Thermoanaerobaculales bacterium]HQN94737.1 FtsX-like permease family protein [Thermoanaerobaculales bacterium]HQP42382.1 FtsX-like permease family protein [Thermoanaerobaculales bacterium]
MLRRLKLLEFALSSLWRRRFKNLAIVVVYGFTIAVLASVLLMTDSLRGEAQQILRGAPDLVVQRVAAGRHDLIPTTYAEEIRALPGVGDVRPRYWGYYFDAFTESNFTFVGIDDGSPGELELLEGRLPSAPFECAVGEGVARVRSTGVGHELTLIAHDGLGVIFDVVGEFRAPSSILTNDLVVFTDADLVELFGFPAGRAVDLSVEVYNDAEVSTVAAKVKRIFPDTRPITRSEILRTYDAVFSWRSGMLLTVFAAALAAFCILAWDKATGISAEERREIGVLKALGWSTRDVLELKFWEGAAISLTSFLLGLIAALAHVFLLGASLLAPVIRGWSVLFPDFRFTPSVSLYQLFVLGFLTVVPYVASTVAPSWKAAVTDPEEVMRG